jgi:hypothetical protein
MEKEVLDYQKQLLEKGYSYLYLCEEIDSYDWGRKKYYQAVIPGDHPCSPCNNDCPIMIQSDQGLEVIREYLSSDNIDLSLKPL